LHASCQYNFSTGAGALLAFFQIVCPAGRYPLAEPMVIIGSDTMTVASQAAFRFIG
jgi:hypothetical protein